MLPKQEFTSIGQVSSPFALNGSETREDVYLIDLDALVPAPFGRLKEDYAAYLADFAAQRPTYLLTRTGYTDVMSRLPSPLRDALAGVFANAGTELWVKEDLIVQHEHDFSDDLYEFIVKAVHSSAYPDKMTPMLDSGSATLRICLAGTRSTARQQSAYAVWEREHRELPAIMSEFSIRFPDYRIFQDSDTSLLIMPASYSTALVRSQILKRHKASRLIGYLAPESCASYAAPLCDALLKTDIISEVGGPSDISQLLSYEKRHLPRRVPSGSVLLQHLQEA